jgi:hypothetical protein
VTERNATSGENEEMTLQLKAAGRFRVSKKSATTCGSSTRALFFYGDRYAGSWQRGKFGGLMSGQIEKQSP